MRFDNIPPVVKNLLLLNVVIFALRFVLQQRGIILDDYLGLHYWEGSLFRPYQFVSYMFMHGSLMHIFFNMFALFMFGKQLEQVWGPKRFAVFYLLTGFGAGLLHYLTKYPDISTSFALVDQAIEYASPENIRLVLVDMNDHMRDYAGRWPEAYNKAIYFQNNHLADLMQNPTNVAIQNKAREFLSLYRDACGNGVPVVGASGSVFGLLLAFGMMFPDLRLMLLFPPIPIKAKYFVMGYGAIELYQGMFGGANDNVAHWAHLGGMLFGFILLKLWGQKRVM